MSPTLVMNVEYFVCIFIVFTAVSYLLLTLHDELRGKNLYTAACESFRAGMAYVIPTPVDMDLHLEQVHELGAELPQEVFDMLIEGSYADLWKRRELLAPFFKARLERGDTDAEHVARAYGELAELARSSYRYSNALLIALLIGKKCVGLNLKTNSFPRRDGIYTHLVVGRELKRATVGCADDA